MKDILTIRWVHLDNPSRPTHISAHSGPEDARNFIGTFRTENPDMRPEISGGRDQKTVGAHRLPVKATQANLPLIQALEGEGSILFPIDPQNPSPFLENYQSMRGAFARIAGVPIEVLRMEGGHMAPPPRTRPPQERHAHSKR